MQITRLKIILLITVQIFKLETWFTIAPYFEGFYQVSQEPLFTWRVHNDQWGTVVTPYGVSWFLINNLLTSTGYWMFGIYAFIIDTVLVWSMIRSQSFRFTFLLSLSTYSFFLFSPWDLVPLWLAALGKRKWYMSIIAALTKLPFPAPYLWVWQFIFTTSIPESIGQFMVFRYFLLGLWIIHPLFFSSRMGRLSPAALYARASRLFHPSRETRT